jgi:hypothetical protein
VGDAVVGDGGCAVWLCCGDRVESCEVGTDIAKVMGCVPWGVWDVCCACWVVDAVWEMRCVFWGVGVV